MATLSLPQLPPTLPKLRPSSFGCVPSGLFGLEAPSLPIMLIWPILLRALFLVVWPLFKRLEPLLLLLLLVVCHPSLRPVLPCLQTQQSLQL